MQDKSQNLTEFVENYSTQEHAVSEFQNETDSDDPASVLGPPLYIVLSSTILYCLIFLVGTVGNILVIIVIVKSRTMKTIVNKYLLNLCMADLLVIIVCMPTALADIFTKEVWYFGEFMCKFVPFLENTIAHSSVLTILAISIERYRVVCYPLKGIDEDVTKVWKIIIVIWLTSSLTSAPWLYIAILRPSTFYDGTEVQVCRNPIVQTWQKVYIVALSLLFFLIPSMIMLLLNCHLCRVLTKNRVLDKSSIHENRSERKRKQNQVANTIASIVTIFFICHLPYRVAVLWFSFEDKHVIWGLGLERFLLIVYSTRIMFYINHALNPVVYNFVSSKFRSALKDLCRKTRRKKCMSMATLMARLSNETPKSGLSNKTGNRCTLSNKSIVINHMQLDETRTRRLLLELPRGGNDGKQIRVAKGSSDSNCDSSLSDNEYSVRLLIEDKNVAIKFKLKKQGLSHFDKH